MRPRLPLRIVLSLLAFTLAASSFGTPSLAAVNPNRANLTAAPRLMAPFDGQRAVESSIRFIYELPRDAGQANLVVSTRPFETSGWTAIPSEEGLTVMNAGREGMTFAATGLRVESDQPMYWAVVARDAVTGALRSSEVRRFIPLPRFQNRVAPAARPLPSQMGRLERAEALGLRPVELAAGYTLTPGQARPSLPTELTIAGTLGGRRLNANQAIVVQFGALDAEASRARIAAVGGAIIAHLPERAYLVRASEAARAELERAPATNAAWVQDWEPAYKVSARIDRTSPERAKFQAQVFPDANLAELSTELALLGATSVQTSDNGMNRLVSFEIANQSIASVAARGELVWIEHAPRFELFNDNAQWVVQTGVTNSRRVWDQGIRGDGQVVMTSDSGVRPSHDQFRDNAVPLSAFGDFPTHRKIIAYKLGSDDLNVVFGDHAGASYHGTHTAGTVVGSDDPVAASARDGMAKNAKLYFMDLSGAALANGVSTFLDLNDLFLPSYTGNAGGAARLSSNSWGSANGGVYDLNCMQTDQFMSAHPDYLIMFATGNAGTAGSVGSPASAKNIVSVGGTGNGASQGNIYASTSRGPTQDGRRKPTLCSPAVSLFSANGASNTTYQALSGTSMATPSTTGAIALMRQYLADGWYPTGAAVPANGFSPSAALLKAMAINSADNAVTGFTTPDNNVGWGRINTDNVLYFNTDTRRLLLVDQTEGLVDDQYIEYQINVVDGAVPFEVTLVWTDVAGHPASARQIVNDLDLTLMQGVTSYKGNVWSAGASTTGGSRDSINVEENIRLAAPPTGVWTVRVAAPNVPLGPQAFALVITGGVGQAAGALALDRSEYALTDTLELEVIDTNESGPISVTVSSTTEGAGEVATLTGSNGVFRGTLPIAPTLSTPSDGVLSVSSGDLLTATYNDASPAATLNAQASVSGSNVVITNVSATPTAAGTTRIDWTTDRAASSKVWYSVSPPLLTSATSPGYGTSHSVTLNGLAAGVTYNYDVESAPITGGATRDSLGGAHRQFTAKGAGDVLLMLGDAGFAGNGAWTTALTTLGYEFDVLSDDAIEPPTVGNASAGLRAYSAVLFQAGPDNYPPVSDTQRAAIDSLVEGGGRFLISGHDLGWGLADPASPSYTPERETWFSTGLKATYLSDPLNWTLENGIAADPISGAYTGGLTYVSLRDGGAGDHVGLAAGSGGTGAFTWRSNFAPPDNDAIRWESTLPKGAAGNAFWGGANSRLVGMFYEWSRLGTAATTNNASRTDVLGKSIEYLLGRSRPSVVISAPNGGEVFTGSSITVNYTVTPAGGFSVANRTLHYSLDAGSSWILIDNNVPGATSYNWDISAIPNSTRVLLRLAATDNGTPGLTGRDQCNAVFTINRAAGDAAGPVVLAGSPNANPAPMLIPNAATLSASISDLETGGGTVVAAEWSVGAAPAAAGSGTAMSGAFGTTQVAVTASVPTNSLSSGLNTLWVRGQDAAGNWGPATPLEVTVNGDSQVGVPPTPSINFLATGRPNPFVDVTTLRFGLAKPGFATLELFDTQGRRVRTLTNGSLAAGQHSATWDGRDDRGSKLGAGVYLVRLTVPGATFRSRVVSLK
ncbi:MAG: S8 family serine peptidase [Candidatus Eisenbacteria bacterium]|uniref:S8 family serine peptidase n=1 Tax=Eiseniibacteriota bacterium TaxID=2212470 RepID=A0A849SJ42_UNCEI|nr:S8 family serine peptidase [Candidatus Eisenbacteria bacterium]